MEHKILKKMNVKKLLLILSFFPFTSFTQNYLDEIFNNWRRNLNDEYTNVIFLDDDNYEKNILKLVVDSLVVLSAQDTIIYYWQKDSIGNKMGFFLEYKKSEYLKVIDGFHSKKLQTTKEYWHINYNKVGYHYYHENLKKKLFKKRLRRRNYKRQREYYIPPLDF